MYHHQYNYDHMLDVYYNDGKFWLRLDGFDPVEVPREFGVNMGDLIYEVVEDTRNKEVQRMVGLVTNYLLSETSDKDYCNGCDKNKTISVLTSVLNDLTKEVDV